MTQSPTPPSEQASTLDKVYLALASDDDGRLCDDIPESQCQQQPRNFFVHTLALSMTKLADGLIDPKLILTWLLTNLGSAPGIIALLVPIRESGALLPQLATASWVRSRPIRKWVWVLGSILQGTAACGILLAVMFLSGNNAGWAVVAALALLALARSLCSVSYKDILGKTVAKSTRGSVTGLASSIAATGVILLALLLAWPNTFNPQNLLLIAVGLAAVLWLCGAIIMSQLSEARGATDGGRNAITDLPQHISQAFANRQFRIFLAVRALYIATALAPPFLLLLQPSQQTIGFLSFEISGLNQLGLFIFASAAASLLSSYFWGRLSDRSSRRVLQLSGLLATLVLAITAALGLSNSALLQSSLTLPTALFILMISYQGVRLGRSTHLVDMATEENRAHFTAVANTAIGLLLMAGAVFGLLAEVIGVPWVLLVMALLTLIGSLLSLALTNVQSTDS
ncbi:MAG: MFS transporter [Gammaproteobacteria bacterium]|nr:MFS transporter [Gammaproteobacteria bacterium]